MTEVPDRPYAHWTIRLEEGWYQTLILSPPPPSWYAFVEIRHGPIREIEKYEAWRKLVMYQLDDVVSSTPA